MAHMLTLHTDQIYNGHHIFFVTDLIVASFFYNLQ